MLEFIHMLPSACEGIESPNRIEIFRGDCVTNHGVLLLGIARRRLDVSAENVDQVSDARCILT